MTQEQKTESVIESAWTNNCHDTPADVALEAHARDLARKLDAVMEWVTMAEQSEDPETRRAGAGLRAIVDGE